MHLRNDMNEMRKVLLPKDRRFPELPNLRRTELERGARMVDAMITNTMLPEIGLEFLTHLANGNAINRVHVTVIDGNFAFA
jgi:type VI secretion system protein VasG